MDVPPQLPIDDTGFIRITPDLAIPRAEVEFRTSRSGGPGGQHVNKVETRVELFFDVAGSPSLSDEQRERLLAALGSRLDSDGTLRIVAASSRSQLRNREEAVARFVLLLQHALRPQRPRKPTRVPRRVHEKRLETKRQRGEIKRRRGQRGFEE
ncbi:MAG: alternative ribosome rescue aminoacyl-tRNA hydrolase ArfB [Armatimonadota bacterium]